jgi:hypothetical protein
MASNQSNAGEQGASFENGAPRCDATRPTANFKRQIKHVVGPFETYICADSWSKAHGCGEDNPSEAEVSPAKARREAATKARREARADGAKKGIMQYVVKVPIEDEGAKSMLWSLGQSALSKSPLFSAVRAVVTTESLQEIVSSILAAPGSERLLAESSERKDLREFTEAAAASEDLFALLAAVAADSSLQEILRATITTPRLADLLLKVSRRDDLRKLTEALSAKVAFTDAAFELAKAGGELLGSLAEIIRVAAGGDSALVTSAIAIALQDPEAIVKTAAIRRTGGVRAKITNWLLGVR